MVQKIIELGGKNYTEDDLRRDILKIEMEDILRKQDKQFGIESNTNQEEVRQNNGNMT